MSSPSHMPLADQPIGRSGDVHSDLAPSVEPTMGFISLRAIAKWLMIAVTVAMFFVYVGSYAYLSRRGMREARDYNSEGILYMSFQEVEQSHDLTRHHRLRILFMPLNIIDQLVLGADEPVLGITFELS